MKLTLLTGTAAALLLMGSLTAKAETIYLAEPQVVETAPGYVLSTPDPDDVVGDRTYVVTAPAPVVIAPQPGYVVERPVVVAPPRETYRETYRVRPRERDIVTTGSSTTCMVDAFGVERCF